MLPNQTLNPNRCAFQKNPFLQDAYGQRTVHNLQEELLKAFSTLSVWMLTDHLLKWHFGQLAADWREQLYEKKTFTLHICME